MPYRLTWHNEEQRILLLDIEDPMTGDAMQSLRDEMIAVVEAPTPLFVMVNLDAFNVLNAIQRMLLSLDGDPFPDLSQHSHHSRLAVVGGGAAIPMILNLARQIGNYSDLIQNFAETEQAIKWLEQESQR